MGVAIVSKKLVVDAGSGSVSKRPAAESDYAVSWSFEPLVDGQIISFLIGANDRNGTGAAEVEVERVASLDWIGETYTPACILRIKESGGTLAEAPFLAGGLAGVGGCPAGITMCLRHGRVSVDGLWADVSATGRYYGVKAVAETATITGVSIEPVTKGDDEDEEGDPTGDCATCNCMTTELMLGESIQDMATRAIALEVSGVSDVQEEDVAHTGSECPNDGTGCYTMVDGGNQVNGSYMMTFGGYTYDANGCICSASFSTNIPPYDRTVHTYGDLTPDGCAYDPLSSTTIGSIGDFTAGVYVAMTIRCDGSADLSLINNNGGSVIDSYSWPPGTVAGGVLSLVFNSTMYQKRSGCSGTETFTDGAVLTFEVV